MTADLSALIARLEAAEAGSRELDEAISDALCVRKTRHFIAGVPDELWLYEFDGHEPSSALRVTQSLDAALALAERVLPEESFWQVGHSAIVNGKLLYNAEVYPPNATCDTGSPWGHASTPALALVIATLRAKQGEGE